MRLKYFIEVYLCKIIPWTISDNEVLVRCVLTPLHYSKSKSKIKSSSFIIHGIMVSNEEFSKINDYHGLSYKENRYYFSDDEPDGYILGVSGGYMNDGSVTKINKLSDDDKLEIISKFQKIGIETTIDKIETYVQYVSDDNY